MAIVNATSPAEAIIEKFGGLTRTAEALSSDERAFAVSTVQGWKVRGRIPQSYWPQLIAAGRSEGFDLPLDMFLGQHAEAAE